MTAHASTSNSPEGSIAPSTLRALTVFAGFASETYLGKKRVE
jgi:hypothetical protein